MPSDDDSAQRTGHCLCGIVIVSVPARANDIGVCHCAMCRRWNSGPWMSLQVPEAKVSGATLKIFRSSGFAERGFGSNCGTHIFHRPIDGPELAISAGLFKTGDFYIAREIFSDVNPAFYHFVADSEKRSSASMIREWLPRLAWRRIKASLGRSES